MNWPLFRLLQGKRVRCCDVDAARFFRSLFVDWHQFAVRWWVARGNPAEELYDRLIEKHGGVVSGIERQALLPPDQTRVDRKRYEVLASEVRL